MKMGGVDKRFHANPPAKSKITDISAVTTPNPISATGGESDVSKSTSRLGACSTRPRGKNREDLQETFVSITGGVQKRDIQAAKKGFAVEFPLLCAKLGGTIIPEVVVLENNVSMPIIPVHREISESTPQDMRLRMLSNAEFQMPSFPYYSVEQLSGTPGTSPTITEGFTDMSTFYGTSTSLENSCMPPSPVAFVQFDTSEKSLNLKKFLMKGAQADDKIIDALGVCLSWYPSLDTIVFENCKISDKALGILSFHMRNAKTVRELQISYNPISEENFHILLEDGTGLENLTLRMCDISDKGASALARELHFRDPPLYQSLLSLNLTSNKIGDDGAVAMAQALRTNRTLKRLILSDNQIGDIGAAALAAATMKFPLTSEEIFYRNNRSIMRRNLRDQKIMAMQMNEMQMNEMQMNEMQMNEMQMNEMQMNEMEMNEMQMREIQKKETQMKEMERKEIAGSKDREQQGRSGRGTRPTKDIKDLVSKKMGIDKHPYIWDARPDGTDLWCVGNVTLENINLSYNNVGEKGALKILDAVKYQYSFKKAERRVETGLSAVDVEGNPQLSGKPVMRRLQEFLSQKMRLNKNPSHLLRVPKTIKGKMQKSYVHRPPPVALVDQNSTYTGFFRKTEEDIGSVQDSLDEEFAERRIMRKRRSKTSNFPRQDNKRQMT